MFCERIGGGVGRNSSSSSTSSSSISTSDVFPAICSVAPCRLKSFLYHDHDHHRHHHHHHDYYYYCSSSLEGFSLSVATLINKCCRKGSEMLKRFRCLQFSAAHDELEDEATLELLPSLDDLEAIFFSAELNVWTWQVEGEAQGEFEIMMVMM